MSVTVTLPPVLRSSSGSNTRSCSRRWPTISGGRLAAAVTAAGGLGLIGGGYGDAEWLQREFDRAEGAHESAYGFITWSLARNPELLDVALARQPATIMLSFGDSAAVRRPHPRGRRSAHRPGAEPRPRTPGPGRRRGRHRGAGRRGRRARNDGARSTFTLVPDVVDLVAERSPETLVVAAGGVADGRGLAAALALGADGALVGTRLWASHGGAGVATSAAAGHPGERRRHRSHPGL